jgi:hypothetical protein
MALAAAVPLPATASAASPPPPGVSVAAGVTVGDALEVGVKDAVADAVALNVAIGDPVEVAVTVDDGVVLSAGDAVALPVEDGVGTVVSVGVAIGESVDVAVAADDGVPVVVAAAVGVAGAGADKYTSVIVAPMSARPTNPSSFASAAALPGICRARMRNSAVTSETRTTPSRLLSPGVTAFAVAGINSRSISTCRVYRLSCAIMRRDDD